jgi:hypothetical protein
MPAVLAAWPNDWAPTDPHASTILVLPPTSWKPAHGFATSLQLVSLVHARLHFVIVAFPLPSTSWTHTLPIPQSADVMQLCVH